MDDPFTTPQRTSVQDSNSHLISLPTSSPSQIKRTLEAHLAEVSKRIETAGNLGRALLKQQQEYESRIKELDEAGDTVDPELKKKLQDLEKEYNEVGRESARAVLTNKIMGGGGGTSPYAAGNVWCLILFSALSHPLLRVDLQISVGGFKIKLISFLFTTTDHPIDRSKSTGSWHKLPFKTYITSPAKSAIPTTRSRVRG